MKLPRLRYSLRAMIAVVLVFATALGWYVNRVQRQRRVVDEILEKGGTVFYDYQAREDRWTSRIHDPNASPRQPEWLRNLIGPEYFDSVVSVSFRGKPVTDDDLKDLKYLPTLDFLELSNTKITSAGMVDVGQLRNLKILSLSDTQVDNECMPHIAKLHNLEKLFLWNTHIDDEGLQYIAHLKQLNNLVLDGTQITDEGLVHLERLTNLEEWLGLAHTGVTDDGLVHLKGMTKLRSLTLWDTEVTKEGVRDLKQFLPKAQVAYGPYTPMPEPPRRRPQ